MDVLYELIYCKPEMVMIVGGTCSEVTKTLGKIVPYWNLILLSYSSISPALSKREVYQTFFRLASADSSYNPARRMFIKHFNWDTVSAIHEDGEVFSLALGDLAKQFEKHNITLKSTEAFTTDLTSKLRHLQKDDARILFGSFTEPAARKVFCEAYKLGIYGPRYVWMLSGSYTGEWWTGGNDTPCTDHQLYDAVQGYFTVENINKLTGEKKSISGLTTLGFLREYAENNGTSPISVHALNAYDTIWTVALTLRKALAVDRNEEEESKLRLREFRYEAGAATTEMFMRLIERLDFLGVSVTESPYNNNLFEYEKSESSEETKGNGLSTKNGKESRSASNSSSTSQQVTTLRSRPSAFITLMTSPAAVKAVFTSRISASCQGHVSFKGPDRQGVAVVKQNQGGTMKIVALYEPDNNDSLNFSCDGCVPVYWKGNRVPHDKNVIVTRQKSIDSTTFFTVCALCVFGIIMALVFLCFNLYYRSLKYIKLSSPILNNVAVIGCIQVYLAVVLLGFDENTLRSHFYPFVCTSRAFLFAAGFSLSFGAMFTKTYRVHQIFTRANSGLIKSKLLRDKQLLFIIGALLVVDSCIISVWAMVDPMHQEITNLSSLPSDMDDDVVYISQLSRCHSFHLEKWMGAFYAYKGLLLVFGVYMAWETRSVKIPVLNDSQYIGLNVYNVVLMSTLVVVLSNIISDQPTLAFAIQSAFIFLSTTGTLCLLFVPKIYAIITTKGNTVITASGITVQGNNIRRFAVDNRKELHYRAEVQNRAYKRELLAIEQEINNVSLLLDLPTRPYSKLTEGLLCFLPESKTDSSPIELRQQKRRGLQSFHSLSDGEDMISFCGDSTDDSRQEWHRNDSESDLPSKDLSPVGHADRQFRGLMLRQLVSPKDGLVSKSGKREAAPKREGRGRAEKAPRTGKGRRRHSSACQRAEKSVRFTADSDTISEDSLGGGAAEGRGRLVYAKSPRPSRLSLELKILDNNLSRMRLCAAQESDNESDSSFPTSGLSSASDRLGVIEHERKFRIRQLQAGLSRMQKDLNVLDNLEHDTSYV